jgi:Papain family cysteine protease
MINEGTTTALIRPHRARQEQCPVDISRPYYAVSWVPLDRDCYCVLSPAEIKKGLCDFGPVTAYMIITPSFQAYTGGVYPQVEPTDDYDDSAGHIVVITGRDDDKGAWEIKNSWGTGWGIGGYAWMKHGANLIGHCVMAVQAVQDDLSSEGLASLRRQLALVTSESTATPQPDSSGGVEQPARQH